MHRRLRVGGYDGTQVVTGAGSVFQFFGHHHAPAIGQNVSPNWKAPSECSISVSPTPSQAVGIWVRILTSPEASVIQYKFFKPEMAHRVGLA